MIVIAQVQRTHDLIVRLDNGSRQCFNSAVPDPKAYLRANAPQTYRLLIATRNAERRRRRARRAPRATQELRAQDAVVGVVDQPVGMGGLLHNAARLLYAGSLFDCRVELAFESATYRPSDMSEGDWLERYFDRLVPRSSGVLSRVRSSDLDDGIDLPPALWSGLVWSHIRLKGSIQEHAAPYLSEPFVAVHYRGSDKYLEARRSSEETVIAAVHSALLRTGLDRVFVASDEPAFVEKALREFGGRAMALPLDAVAEGGTPPHFSDIAGEVKAHEALLTMHILSRAKVLVRTESLMSQWALDMSLVRPEEVLVTA